MSPKKAGIALAVTLVAGFVLCSIAQVVLFGMQFSHMWVNIFTSAPVGSVRSWVEGIVASAVVGMAYGYIFATVYNRVSK